MLDWCELHAFSQDKRKLLYIVDHERLAVNYFVFFTGRNLPETRRRKVRRVIKLIKSSKLRCGHRIPCGFKSDIGLTRQG